MNVHANTIFVLIHSSLITFECKYLLITFEWALCHVNVCICVVCTVVSDAYIKYAHFSVKYKYLIALYFN